jgi:diguanylate cyclase (GGDEF)-like protein
MRFILGSAAGLLGQAGDLLRRPEVLVFLPALTLASFWLGGEEMLTIVALGLPMVFVMTGAIGLRDSSADTQADATDGIAARPQLTARLDEVLRLAASREMTTACLVVQFDDAERLLDRHGRAVQAEVLERSADRMFGVLRQGDTLARLEGGGFAVALGAVRRLDLEILVQLAARIQAALSVPILVQGAQIYVTCSVGFCLASRAPQNSGRSLLDAAQIAADEALRNGPGAIRAFAPGMARNRADREAQR